MRINGTDGRFISKYIDKRVNYAAGFVFDSNELYVTGPYAGNVIVAFSESEQDNIAQFSKVYSDRYMRNCQGLQLHNQTLYSACRYVVDGISIRYLTSMPLSGVLGVII